MEDQYGMADLRHYITSRPLFPSIPPPSPELLPNHRGLSAAAHPYDMLVFRSDSAVTNGGAASSSVAAANCFGDGDGAGRWPRQETLTLLEIRSRLDPKFKEANQKGPLWDEVSRIMSGEHGYQRSGKKCREKFENLYKYYKKTKEGKAGRQNGKHYRFFRQLEALYGEANISASISEPYNEEKSLTLSNYDSTSSNGSDQKTKKRGVWKAKIKDIIDAQMKKLMEKQEAWMERMMRTIEEKERERLMREEEWRKQDSLRIEKEQKFWANERAWIEARDVALMESLHKLISKESRAEEHSETMTNTADIWPECEINRLMQMRATMEGKVQERGMSEEMMWDEIATKMACFGHERSGLMCKEKWDSVNNDVLKCSKKRREYSKGCTYFHSHESIGGGVDNYCDNSEQGHINGDHHHHIRLSHDHGSSSPNRKASTAINEGCFRYFMGDAYGRI